MDPLTISAASGMRARMESLDMLANNIANASTGGYKADREFYSLYTAPEAAGSQPEADTLPVIERPWTDFSQGELHATGNPLDVALAGFGFFTVNGPSGPLYTRNGNFRLSDAGVLTTVEGYPVRTSDGVPLTLTSASPVEISRDGTVGQDGTMVGQLELVDFANRMSLEKQGHNYFRQTDTSAKLVAPAGTEVQQGQMEISNADSAFGAVRLISVMRQFEALQKAVLLGNQMNRQAVEQVAKV